MSTPGVEGGTAHGAEHSANLMLLGIGALIGWIGWLAGVKMGLNSSRAFLPQSTHALSLDAIYNATFVRAGFAIAAVCRWIDENILDGIVNIVGGFVAQVGEALRAMQTSYVRNYALTMALGAVVVVAWFLTQRVSP